MKIFYNKDADMARLDGKTIAIIGYGSQTPKWRGDIPPITIPCQPAGAPGGGMPERLW